MQQVACSSTSGPVISNAVYVMALHTSSIPRLASIDLHGWQVRAGPPRCCYPLLVWSLKSSRNGVLIGLMNRMPHLDFAAFACVSSASGHLCEQVWGVAALGNIIASHAGIFKHVMSTKVALARNVISLDISHHSTILPHVEDLSIPRQHPDC